MPVRDLSRAVAAVAAAEHGSFARAARALGLTPAAVSKSVAALEAELGRRLFERTTRAMRPTVAGEAYLDACRRALSILDEGEAAARGLAALGARAAWT